MLSRLPERPAASRDRLFRAVLVALAIGQLVAFWMLCSHQVRKAQMRDVGLAVQRVAIADCLQYIPRATLNSCINRVDPSRESSAVMATGHKPTAAPDATRATMSSGTPVSVSYQ
ncbi:MAG TPA: hypothetical protein VGA59_11675 [Ramlibacter sp.]|jgi:hypothetical protein